MKTDSARSAPLTRRTAWMLLALLCAAYAVVVGTHLNRGYLDFGDGNYMYISWRLAGGAALYHDVLAPQPPMHLLTGRLIVLAAGAAGVEPLWGFRLFSLALHLASALLVYLVACRVTAPCPPRSGAPALTRAAGVVAAGVYLFLPLGFWWSLGYQSEPLEMFFFLLSFLLFITWSPRLMPAAGALMALAPLTNMTAAPYALFSIGYAAVRRPRLALLYAVPLVGVVAAVTLWMQWRTGAYLENVILNQVGSFPRQELLPQGQTLWTYAWGKIVREGTDVLNLEGGFIALALFGLARFARRGDPAIREYTAWYAFFALCSIIYVSKGGTMDYIFTIGEPFVAVFAGYLAFHFGRKHLAGWWAGFGWRDLSPVAGVFAGGMLLAALAAPGIQHSLATLRQQTYELNEYETAMIVDMIRANTEPDGLVLAPPMYAFLAQRRIPEDYSEIFLWSLKYQNERTDGVRGRGVETAERIAAMLNAKKVDFVVLDLAQTGRLPEIRQAIDDNYQPLRDKEFRTLNTRLMFYKPK